MDAECPPKLPKVQKIITKQKLQNLVKNIYSTCYE
jgi:hypothetical protein